MRRNKPVAQIMVSSLILSMLALSVHAAGRSGDDRINGVDLLSGFDTLWTTGATWDTGTPTALGQSLLRRNLQIVVDRANSRTLAQETAAYFDDRRDQSYSATSGLGSLTAAYRAGAGAFTTITQFDDSNKTVKYDDKGNGAGSSTSALGKVVDLVARCATTRPPRQPNPTICTRARGDKAWTAKAWPSWLRLPCARRKAPRRPATRVSPADIPTQPICLPTHWPTPSLSVSAS